MQLGMICMDKDLRISAGGRLGPISKLHVFNSAIYLMQNGNLKSSKYIAIFHVPLTVNVHGRDFIITVK